MKRKVTLFETIWYVFCCLVAAAGITFITLGLVGQLGSTDVANLRKFFLPGCLTLPGAAILAVIVLLIYAKTNDRASEIAARRAARLAKVDSSKAE